MRASRVAGIGWLIAATFAFAAPVATQEPLAGRWTAEARLGPEVMALQLDVERRDGTLTGRISVPAERVLGLQLDAFRCGDGDVAFRIPHADHPMDFSGRLADEQRLQGTLTMGPRALPLVFVHRGATPEKPYRELEVSFPGEGRTVQGSLLVPPGDGPLRALATFHATSTGQRDHLRFLADPAARAGLAALIYDRRPVPSDVAVLTRADFLAVVADAEAAVRYLRSRADIDGAHVGVGGLSQGAWIAAMTAARVPEVAFVVALSAPGVPLHEIDLYQSMRRLEAAGVQAPERAEARDLLTALFAASRGESVDRDALTQRLELARRAPWARSLALPDDMPPRGASGALLRWSAHDLDPMLSFERLRVPVFLAFGERDERLPAEASASRIAASLQRAGNDAVTMHRYPGANHALSPAPTFDQDLARWLRERAGQEPRPTAATVTARIEVESHEHSFTVRFYLRNAGASDVELVHGRGGAGLQVVPEFRVAGLTITPPTYLHPPRRSMTADVTRVPAGQEIVYGVFTMGYPPIEREQGSSEPLSAFIHFRELKVTLETQPQLLRIPARRQ